MDARRGTALVAVAALALAGCGPARDAAPEPLPQPKAAGPALRLGVMPEQNIFRQVERYEPLVRYLGKKLGLKLEVRPVDGYSGIVAALERGDVDGAFLGSFTYALAHAEAGVEPLARPESADGRSTYHGLVLVRKDSGLRRAEDLRGKRFALVDRATTAYLIALDYLTQAGIHDPASFLGETYYAGTHEDVVRDVFDRRADVGAAKNSVFERMARENPALGEQLVALARSPDVPESTLAMHPRVAPDVRAKLKAALLAMDGDADGRRVLERFGARRFIATGDADFEIVYRYARKNGIDLSRPGTPPRHAP